MVKSLLLLLIVSTLMLFIAEMVSRYAFGSPTGRLLPQVKYYPHPIRRFTLRPDQEAYTYNAEVTIDQHGFRINDKDKIIDPNVRVFALGDSFTFGMGVNNHETWPALLEDQLNELAELNSSVINGGVVSYSLFHELEYYKEHAKEIKPNILIHALYWNDYLMAEPSKLNASPVITNNGYFAWNRFPERYDMAKNLIEYSSSYSSFVSLIRRVIYRFSETPNQKQSGYALAYQNLVAGTIDNSNLNRIKSFYEQLLTITKRADTELFVIIMPVIGIVDDLDHAYPKAIRKLLSEMNISFVDGFQIFKANGVGKEVFLPQGNDAHLNVKGYEQVAKTIKSKLMRESQHFRVNVAHASGGR